MNDRPNNQNWKILREDFQHNGFLILREFLDGQELNDLTRYTQEYLDKTNYSQELKDFNGQPFKGTRKNLQSDVPWFEGVLLKGKPYQTISTLLEDELEPATVAYFERIPGEQKAISPHFDAIGHRRFGATLWIALDHARIHNGCLYYSPGSHRNKYSSTISHDEFNKLLPDAVPIEIDRGDAAIHSSLTLHWSNPNHSELRRRAISFFYWCKT